MAVNLHYTADEIFYILFDNDPNSISLVYLMKLVVKLRNDAFAIAYTAGPRLRLGRNRMLSRLEALCLVDIALLRKSIHYDKLTKYFREEFYIIDEDEHASRSTIMRTLKRMHITNKKVSKININLNPLDGAHYLQNIAHIDPFQIIDVDETINDTDSFFLEFGYAPEGERCYKTQLIINNKTYSTIAACTPLGFLCWEVFDGKINGDVFGKFIQQTLNPFLKDSSFVVLDNASTHHTAEVRMILDTFLDGKYYYCAAYSPH
jgi:hypothetical protein